MHECDCDCVWCRLGVFLPIVVKMCDESLIVARPFIPVIGEMTAEN